MFGGTDDGLADVFFSGCRTAAVDDVVRGGEEGLRLCHHLGRTVDDPPLRIVDEGIAGSSIGLAHVVGK
jgi:hypothetical protein